MSHELPCWVGPSKRWGQSLDEFSIQGAYGVRNEHCVRVPADKPCSQERGKVDRLWEGAAAACGGGES